MEFFNIVELLFLFVFLVFLGGVFLTFYDRFFSQETEVSYYFKPRYETVNVSEITNRNLVNNVNEYNTTFETKVATYNNMTVSNSSGWFNYSSRKQITYKFELYYSYNNVSYTKLSSCDLTFSASTYNTTNLLFNFSYTKGSGVWTLAFRRIGSECGSMNVPFDSDFYVRFMLIALAQPDESYRNLRFNYTYNYSYIVYDRISNMYSFDSNVKDKFENGLEYFFSWFGILVAIVVLVVVIATVIGIFK